MRRKGTSCASPIGLSWRANESLALYGTSSPAWKRGSPLSPVVVGEGGASKLTWYTAGVAGVVAMGKVSKASWLMIDEFRSSPVAIPVHVASGTRMALTAGLQDLVRGAVVLLTLVEVDV